MQIQSAIDIIEEDIAEYGRELLDILLKDRATGKNIIWATDDYSSLGNQYNATEEITSGLITGKHKRLIQPRAAKDREQRYSRTRGKAEVFTPSWICNKQNNLIDEQWFGRKNVFNSETEKSWVVNESKITFPADKKHSWQAYVDANRMEITCGEAPYLVSRYDTVTGKTIDIISRIGLLDRKLRIVTENTKNDESEWLKWTYRAYESIYGYEFQGDSLLLARENLFYTFIDNMRHTFGRCPSQKELKRIAVIISWNIWQMDGLTYNPPYCDIAERSAQITIFDLYDGADVSLPSQNVKSRCKIKDWRAKEIIEFCSLIKKR